VEDWNDGMMEWWKTEWKKEISKERQGRWFKYNLARIKEQGKRKKD
jgi:hypothetical protein